VFLGLQDFDLDIFLRLDDEAIELYYSDFETLPQLSNIIPLGSFDEEGKIKLTALNMKDRVDVGIEFMHRDGYAIYDKYTNKTMIRVDRFMKEFDNIPEVEEFFKPYLDMCQTTTPPSWCSDCNLSNDCPEYCQGKNKCSITIPMTEFLKVKGEPVLKFGVGIPPEELDDGTGKMSSVAKLIIKDSDGTQYTAEDSKIYFLGNNTTVARNTGEIIIDPLGTISTNTPTFTGRVVDIRGASVNLSIEDRNSPELGTRDYTVIFDTNGEWTLTLHEDDALSDGNYRITANAYDINNNSVESYENFSIDTKAIIFFTDISDGYINYNEHNRDLLVKGGVQEVEIGQEVRVHLFDKNYYTTVNSNMGWSLVIPAADILRLRDGLSYPITAYVRDIAGNISSTTSIIHVDLQIPNPEININPDITSDDINYAITNNDYFYFNGSVGGTAKEGDLVVVYINNKPYTCNVYKDYEIPVNTNTATAIDYSDLYYIIILYFSGIYRTSPMKTSDFGIYNILTDIDFDLNKYNMILDIKEFFTREFIYFIRTSPGSLPFACDYGTHIKEVVQTKNFIVKEIQVEAEINFFIHGFNTLYGDMVEVQGITIQNRESNIGADEWIIEVFANIKQDRVIYRLEY